MPMLRQAEDSLQQPQRTMLRLVVLMLLPLPRLLLIQSARTALNRLPSPCFHQSRSPVFSTAGILLQSSPFFNLSNVLLLLLCLLLRMSSLLAAFLPQEPPLRLAQVTCLLLPSSCSLASFILPATSEDWITWQGLREQLKST
ncbi:hypothetical protein EYF80_003355 [Liparis tanakae]|uniref:Uncharacterized protein n=1 Tax=Liparis tanakae TaxID=230148 RepID=A0A4Z2J849_9TELE|nr:hypothetical protein EYF80_003355 [Liparis tanakae]